MSTMDSEKARADRQIRGFKSPETAPGAGLLRACMSKLVVHPLSVSLQESSAMYRRSFPLRSGGEKARGAWWTEELRFWITRAQNLIALQRHTL